MLLWDSDQTDSSGLPTASVSGISELWRRGRAAEGTRLLNEHTLKGVSRVRIPPSPPFTFANHEKCISIKGPSAAACPVFGVPGGQTPGGARRKSSSAAVVISSTEIPSSPRSTRSTPHADHRSYRGWPTTLREREPVGGADYWAGQWVLRRRHLGERMEWITISADWHDPSHPDALIRRGTFNRRYDARAGLRRNSKMLEQKPDAVVTLGDGTADMVANW